MKKLVIGGIVGVALAVPSGAVAQVIPGATYTGTFTTGTPGGTVSVLVSADGTQADFSSANWGNNGDCASNSLGRDDMAIENDGFSFFDDGPPLVSISGFFGQPGVVTGSAQISGVCNTGSQSWRAETPVVWPDAILEHAIYGFAGENIYNASGADQSITQKVHPGHIGRFIVHLENDGTEPDDLDVGGCGPSRGFKVKYTKGGDNVTSEVRSGDYETAPLDTNESEALKLIIKVTRKAKIGKAKSCKVTASHSGVFRGTVTPRSDAVKAVVKVKR